MTHGLRLVPSACVAFLFAPLVACEEEGPSTAPRGRPGAAAVTTSPPAQPEPSKNWGGNLPRPTVRGRRGAATEEDFVEGTAAGAAPAASEGDREEPPQRDLSAELRSAFGDPRSCIPPRTPGPPRSSIGLSATFSAEGSVYRSSVSAPFPEEVRRCLERRLTGVHLPGPIPNAPASVSASIEVTRSEDTTTVEYPEFAPQGVRPASTLPAQAPLPTGNAPPSSTLPATGEGRPSGFVPPSSTLPARN